MSLQVRDWDQLLRNLYNDEDVITDTSEEQATVEKSVKKLYQAARNHYRHVNNYPRLLKYEHEKFVKYHLQYLPKGYMCLDASRTWICYWLLHTLSLLEAPLSVARKSAIVEFLKRCQHDEGGYGGGPGQLPHLATTYAAVNSLCIVGTKEAYDSIDRNSLMRFLWSVRCSDGSFIMHKDGEVDIRGVYCALSVATLTNIATPDLFDKTAEWIVSCQTYEGGFSGYPGLEAHGGYAFCGLAALFLLQKTHLCDLKALLRWLVNRQMKFEGGFQGRTNKLVDGCYSFWQGGAVAILHSLLQMEGRAPDDLLFNRAALQEYILVCCQNPDGGLLDKPGKPRDAYHTCYTISGLSVAQHFSDGSTCILGSRTNKLAETNPVFNIRSDLVKRILCYFNVGHIATEENKIQDMSVLAT